MVKVSSAIVGFAVYLAFALSVTAQPAFTEYVSSVPSSFSGKMITMDCAGAGPFNLYFSGKEDARAGVLVLHPWWGLNGWVKSVTDQLAKAGYAAYAIDLYDGRVTDDPEIAQGFYVNTAESPEALIKMRTAAQKIRERHGKIAVVGFSMGGRQALRVATSATVDATVIVYGYVEYDPFVLGKIAGPTLGVYGAKDPYLEPIPEMLPNFEKRMAAMGKQLEIITFDAGHAFMEPENPSFDKTSAQSAWREINRFLFWTLMLE
ncbi:MAG: alpha/beta fold hydrolase [Nitrospinae bacterium]|nr:alpha/beta fold hydrolase [Nitrospinota bacterium]